MSSSSTTTASRAIFLSPDERFEVWTVKKSERPELLERLQQHDHLKSPNEPNCPTADFNQSEPAGQLDITQENIVDDNDADDEEILPLTDGCDLAHWRKHQFAELPTGSETSAVLNVGYGCSLLRRESQLPVRSIRDFDRWNKLRDRLLAPPQTTAAIVDVLDTAGDTCSSSPLAALHPWFERDNVPAILLGCTKNWLAMETCTLQRLVDRFGDLEWRFSDTHGETMTLRAYHKYIQWEGKFDDAPLAIYDSQFADDERATLLDEYTIPTCFNYDLLDLLPDDNRPPYRWILIGPARSGTGLHIDPVGTHAWVTLVEGCKRWVLFPFGTEQASIYMQDPAIPSAIWFRDYYDAVMAEHPRAIEVLQRPGETVYVPAGWPHLVLNLETSVAITHNYASSEPSMERFWQAFAGSEREMARVFFSQLEQHRPDLVEAISIVH